MEINEILREPLTLEELKIATIYLPKENDGKVVVVDDADYATAYRYSELPDRLVDTGVFAEGDENNELLVIEFGIVVLSGGSEVYSFYHAIDNLVVKEVRNLIENLKRNAWEDTVLY